MNPTTNFWNHFKQNNFVFLLLHEIPYAELKIHFDKLVNALHNYNKNLNLIIKKGKDKTELIITANGNPYLFKDVERLVYHAPQINKWEITAFLQPVQNTLQFELGTDQPFIFDKISIKISEMYFTPIKHQDHSSKLGIKVYLKNYIVHKNNPNLKEAVNILIEYLLGEKCFANNIAFIDIDQLTNCNNNDIELYKLYNYLKI